MSITDSSGQTPLMVASKYGHTAIIGEEKGGGGGGGREEPLGGY